MKKRKYTKCEWCGKTIEVTKQEVQLCKECDETPGIRQTATRLRSSD